MAMRFASAHKGNTCCQLLKAGKPVDGTSDNQLRLENGKSYKIVAERRDGQLSLTVDDKPMFSVKDENPPHAPADDMIGLSARVRFEYFKLCRQR